MRTKTGSSRRGSLVMALLVGAAACENVTGPGSLDRLNAEAALTDYEAVDEVLASGGWRSFQMAASRVDLHRFGGAPAGSAANVPLISEQNRGVTFVYDAELRDWVIDPARTGAPANGVRFILYEPNGAEPDPTREIGHADLIDDGDRTAGVALRLVVVERGRTIVDYRTTAEGDESEGHVTVEGFVRNDRDKLDFDIEVNGEKRAGIEKANIAFGMGIDTRDFLVQGEVNAEKHGGSENGDVDLRVRHGARSFQLDVANNGAALSGNIDLDDALFATVSGAPEQPVFKTPDGQPVTGVNALVLFRMFDITEDVFDLFEDLVEPVAELIVLAVVL